jgi:hypothetical protein
MLKVERSQVSDHQFIAIREIFFEVDSRIGEWLVEEKGLEL